MNLRAACSLAIATLLIGAGAGRPALAVDTLTEGTGLHVVSGTISTIDGVELQLQSRAGLLTIDATAALAAQRTTLLAIGTPVTAVGQHTVTGGFHAVAVSRAKSSPALWPPDN